MHRVFLPLLTIMPQLIVFTRARKFLLLFIDCVIYSDSKFFFSSSRSNEATGVNSWYFFQMIYIDMMLLHHPGDGDVEAYLAMEQAAANGKIHSIGLSNWYIEELEKFLPQVNITPALVQNEIHPYYQEPDVVPYIQELGITVQGWHPFGGRGHTSELLGDEAISAIAESHGVTSAQVILRWNLQRGVAVIPGSSNPDHIRENLDLFGFELTEEEMAQIAALNRDEKHDWY